MEELRLEAISTLEAGNAYLLGFVPRASTIALRRTLPDLEIFTVPLGGTRRPISTVNSRLARAALTATLQATPAFLP